MAELEASPITEWELWAIAHEMIRKHGAGAPAFATARAESLDRDGDGKGAATWRLVLHRIGQLQATPCKSSN
jgi:hypothetical protein